MFGSKTTRKEWKNNIVRKSRTSNLTLSIIFRGSGKPPNSKKKF